MTHGVVGCCEVDKHSSGLHFSRKIILVVLCHPGDLVYGRPPVSKARLLPREQWVDDWIDTSGDESLEDFEGVTQPRYGTIALWVPKWLFCDATISDLMKLCWKFGKHLFYLLSLNALIFALCFLYYFWRVSHFILFLTYFPATLTKRCNYRFHGSFMEQMLSSDELKMTNHIQWLVEKIAPWFSTSKENNRF